MMRGVAGAVVLLAALTASDATPPFSNTDPPLGIVATSASLAHILALHRIAGGRLDVTAASSTQRWSYSSGDLSGTQTLVSSGDDYRRDTVLGPFHTADGCYRGQQWDQNPNGLTVLDSGIHQRDDIDAASLKHATTPGSGVTLLGEVGQPQAAWVVRVAPPGGRVEYLFYDLSSYLLVRTEQAVEDLRVVRTYDDFRTTHGVKLAWHVHESDGRPYNEQDWRLQSVTYDTAPPTTNLQPPPSDRSHLRLDAPNVALPVKIIADRIILTAQMGRHKVDFQLDSGASEIVLDKSVADALGITSYGKQTQTTAGTYTSTQAIAPSIAFGGAVLDNVALTTAPFHQWADDSTPVAGLLGFDFIANCVIHIDYLHGQADALDPATFQPPSGSVALPIRLDDDVPVVTATIASATSDRFIIDTGADRSILFSQFVADHPHAAADQGLGEQFTEAYPFIDKVSGVGGEIQVTHTQVPSLALGSASFPRWLFSVVHDAAAFEGEDYDGLIGQDVLRKFDVYLDYPHLKIYLVPNDRFRERYG